MTLEASKFKLIRPILIDSSILTSSTVPEEVAATYAGGTTYAEGDRAGLAPVTGQPQLVYESIAGGNIGNALTDPAYWRYVSSVYPVYAGGTSYAIGDIATDLTNHLLYKSLTAANSGNALTDVVNWENIGPTNRYAAYDNSYSTQSLEGGAMTVVVTPGEVVNNVILLNLSGAYVTLTQADSGHTETINLTTHEVLNWYDFYYELPTRKTEAIFDAIPPRATSAITVEISGSSDTDSAGVGVMVMGRERTIGVTQWEASRSINDYSRAVEDANGSVSLTVGQYSKRLNIDFYVTPGDESLVTSLLEYYRATPLVFIGSLDYDMSIIFGFLGAWSVPLSISGRMASAEIKGLA